MPGISKIIPPPVIRRMTQYLAFVRSQLSNGVDHVTSQQIAGELGLTSSTVRQDFSHLDLHGVSKLGYNTYRLVQTLQKALGTDRAARVAIVGAGNLGRALALYGGFEREGFNICAIFDCDCRVVGGKIGRLTVRPITALASTLAKEKIEIGVIAVPESSAQEVADALVAAGVKGLLNLSPARLRAPKNVMSVDVRILSCFQELLCRMRLQSEPGDASSHGRSA